MIYKLKFEDGRVDWITAKSQLHLLKEYDAEFELSLQDIEELVEISDEDAKTILVVNTEYNENDPDDSDTVPLFDLATDDEFAIIASSEYL
jgi:hypothetical protein